MRNITIIERSPTVLAIAKQGQPGQPGPVGPSGDNLIYVAAGATVNGHRIVGYNAAGDLVKASNEDLQFIETVVGLSLTSGLINDLITIAVGGEVTHSGWNWLPSQPIFLDNAGGLTQFPPVAPALFSLQVAFPTSPTSLWVQISNAIEL